MLDVGLEVRGRLEHVAQDRLGAQAVVARPRHLLAVGLEGGAELVLERLGVGDLGELVHALVVLESLGLHLGEGPSARLALLGAKHLVGVLERGLDHGDEVEVVGVALGVEQLERREQEGRERLIEREVLGEVDREAVDGRARKWRGRGGGQDLEQLRAWRVDGVGELGALDDTGVDEGGEDLVGTGHEPGLLGAGLK